MNRVLLIALLVCAGCASEQDAGGPVSLRTPEPLVTGDAQRERLCGRGNQDLVIDLFCSESPPKVTGLVELREALGLSDEVDLLDKGFVLNGHSTSLVQRSVSAINPRIIFVKVSAEPKDVTAMAFARGERFSEIVVRNRANGGLQFYLAEFRLPCDDTEAGCTPGDLLTPATESGWTSLDLYGEEDLENTPRDCRVCHQPDGPGTRKILRMQELEAPWNHWFYRISEGGQALIADYEAAKGDELFAGVGTDAIRHSQPGLLAFAVFATGSDQDNLFDSARIEAEVRRAAREQGGDQPTDNSVPGQSETWKGIYERAKQGEAISVPYHDVKVTDPDKLASMTEAYTAYREGLMAAEDLPDIRDIYPDDEDLQARMGLVTEPGLSGEEVLMQACAQCHNQRLDQTVSRARFDVDLSRMGPDARARAIARIMLPPDQPGAMPPNLFRQLSKEGRNRLLELLQ